MSSYFLFQRKSVRSGALELQPVSLCMWAYREMEVSRLPPDEGPWGLQYSCLITVTGEGLS